MEDFLTDWQLEFKRWQIETINKNVDILDNIDLETVSGIHQWLSHPSNWKNTDVFIIGWNGLYPWISERHAWKFAPNCKDGKELAEIVLYDRNKRRARHKKNDNVDAREGDED